MWTKGWRSAIWRSFDRQWDIIIIGVGLDHAPYLAAEKGEQGMEWLAALSRTADPDGLLNPGKLLVTAGANLSTLKQGSEPETEGAGKEFSDVDKRLAQRHLA